MAKEICRFQQRILARQRLGRQHSLQRGSTITGPQPPSDADQGTHNEPTVLWWGPANTIRAQTRGGSKRAALRERRPVDAGAPGERK